MDCYFSFLVPKPENTGQSWSSDQSFVNPITEAFISNGYWPCRQFMYLLFTQKILPLDHFFFSQRDKLNIRVQTEGYKGTLDSKTEYWYSSDMNTLLPYNLKQLPTWQIIIYMIVKWQYNCEYAKKNKSIHVCQISNDSNT